ncbi:MAG: PilZ domain-containing protein [Vicinamibacteria bacterium]|nr:PilZ domain-containing protein [Vicinamibacteria bacterium]
MARPKPVPRPTRHDVEALSRLRISFIRRGTLHVEGSTEPVLLMDLARHGAFVERGQPLALGAEVTLEFWLPGNDLPVRAACRVAWTHEHGAPNPTISHALPPGLGLEFVALAEADLARVDAVLLEHLGRPPRARQFSGRHLHR